MGGHARVRTRLGAVGYYPRLATVHGRPLGGYRVGLVFRLDRSLGLGRVPLRALGIRVGSGMVLGARVRLVASVGFVALLPRVRLLVTVRARRLRVRAPLAWMGGSSGRSLHASDQSFPNPGSALRRDRPRREPGRVHGITDGTRPFPRYGALLGERNRSRRRRRPRWQRPPERRHPRRRVYPKRVSRCRSLPRPLQRGHEGLSSPRHCTRLFLWRRSDVLWSEARRIDVLARVCATSLIGNRRSSGNEAGRAMPRSRHRAPGRAPRWRPS